MILIFGGTTEGRIAAETCEQAGKPFYYSTRSSMQDVELHHGVRLSGTMTLPHILLFCQEHEVKCIVDAAHPFAKNLHDTIAQTGLPVIRLQRDFGKRLSGVVYCKDYVEAVRQMEETGVNKLLALSGANTIRSLKPYWSKHPAIFRILHREESLAIARDQGLAEDNLIFYNEDLTLPSVEDEKAMMTSVGCDAIITKESGASGGFERKVEAALSLGLRVFVVEHPELPRQWLYATGPHSLRRFIERVVPEFFPLRTGLTTGACATAATKAALLSLLYDDSPEEVSFALPDGEVMSVAVTIESKGKIESKGAIESKGIIESKGTIEGKGKTESKGTIEGKGKIESNGTIKVQGIASVIKDFSDDPDVTKGCKITSVVTPNDTGQIRFLQGEGVGTVTLPGLGIPVGGPAVNATPRQMIENEIRALSDQGYDVTISVAGGAELALKTFNPKVGVVGGISIIGTSGIVSPLSNEAFIQSIGRELEVARAIGCVEIGIVAGKKSEDNLRLDHPQLRMIHYGNFVGETLKRAHALGFKKVVIGIMIGKAVKLAEGNLDTHSHKVVMNKDFLKSLVSGLPDCDMLIEKINEINMARDLVSFMPKTFFERVASLCHAHCQKVFPDGEIEIKLICDSQV